MANVTDPLIKSVQGSDPQNLMEYITRQKIYDSRFWKEECFGLTAADVMERAAKSLTCVGGTFSGMGKPSKFLSLTLKLLQLQPDKAVVQAFLEQESFKYLRALGAFYLRLTGRPQDIYEMLDPLYADFSKLKYRDVNEWKLMHVDEFVDQLLTQDFCCGIAMPRLPRRETLQEAGYLEDGPRPTALHDKLLEAGGIKEYLQQKVKEEQRQQHTGQEAAGAGSSAISLWERRYGKLKKNKKQGSNSETTRTATVALGGKREADVLASDRTEERPSLPSEDTSKKRKMDDSISIEKKKKKKKEKKQSKKYGTLFKASAVDKDERPNDSEANDKKDDNAPVDQNSEEYWNNLRSSLGMNPLKK